MGKPAEAAYEGKVAEAIRAEIAKLSSKELRFAKPSRILPLLEIAGIKVTPSVRSATSKLLSNAKQSLKDSGGSEIVSFDPTNIENDDTNSRLELAMRLVEACGGDFEIVRTEIARLEEFAKKIKKA